MALDASPMENEPSRILIIDTAWVGDVVFTTALVQAARNIWPRAKISLLVSPRAAGVVRNMQTLDEVIVYDKAKSERSIGGQLRYGFVRASVFSKRAADEIVTRSHSRRL